MAMIPPYIINLDMWAISVLHDHCWMLCHGQDKWCSSYVRLSTFYTCSSHPDSPSPVLKVPFWRGRCVNSLNLAVSCQS